MEWIRRHIKFFDAPYIIHQIPNLRLWRCRFCHKLVEDGSKCEARRYEVDP